MAETRSKKRANLGGGANDLRGLVLACAAHLLVQTGRAEGLRAAFRQAEQCLHSGAPRQKWDEMIEAQGADLAAFQRKLALDHTAPVVAELKAGKGGYVSRCDARLIGEVIRDLGGGRLNKEASINYDVGVDRLVKPGERIDRAGRLMRIHAADARQAAEAAVRLEPAFEISARKPPVKPLLAQVISTA